MLLIKSKCCFLLFLIILSILLKSCHGDTNSFDNTHSKITDSISFCLEKAMDKSLSAKERGKYTMKALVLTENVNDSLKANYLVSIGSRFSMINDYYNF